MRISKNINMHRQSGFTILESLVALVVLSVGLIGAAAVQVSTLKFTQVSQQRSGAAQQLLSISERMRSNLEGVRAANYNIADTYASIPGNLPTLPSCAATCTAQLIAQKDLNQWQTEIARSLPGGVGVINGTQAPLFWQITVMWQEKDLSADMRSACPPALAAPATVQCVTMNFQP